MSLTENTPRKQRMHARKRHPQPQHKLLPLSPN
jgi:hypothetical protein